MDEKKRCPQCHLIRPLDSDGNFKPHGCDVVSVTDDAVEEKLYLVGECGEAFDTIETANEHLKIHWDCSFDIKPESEAM
jgi:hypothetical protein